MIQQWQAEIEITPAQAARLIERQFPRFAPVQLASLGSGWDNAAFLVNARWVFRFPRRAIAAPLILREARALPLLAPHLALPVPVPEYLGVPAQQSVRQNILPACIWAGVCYVLLTEVSGRKQRAAQGTQAGFWAWLGFVATTGIANHSFEQRSFGLFFINGGTIWSHCSSWARYWPCGDNARN